ncbi:lytic transglycosylase domain-containing protein [Sedimentibacter sp. zth1]|uniref:lytic transglycosylase domain-containing protein n=1 Tax=Sedimentibacter sp. zth1 TaxID=2816908 RepID=UPI001A929C85|nr:lytic transglycosylase domain-containing protein [Sedimentibacter sp. zth1]QSX07103.1 lytic transglycosylase domain-containing protein [Sedimentibacter sp. zth1]
MESRNIKQFICLSVFICFVSYVFLFKLSTVVDAEIKEEQEVFSNIAVEKILNTKELITPIKVIENQLLVFVNVETGLKYNECNFMINKCKEKDIDIFLLLGLLKKESGFNPSSTGSSGEMGLAQLMEKTARHYSTQLGYEYSQKIIYDPVTNIDLAIEHLSYLKKLYNGDKHKILTAYNRGTKGLENYIEAKRSPYEELGMSTYSVDTLQYSEEFKEQFVNFDN